MIFFNTYDVYTSICNCNIKLGRLIVFKKYVSTKKILNSAHGNLREIRLTRG